MNQINTNAIVLNRVNYGEADRIITMVTPDYGKIRLMAKGVRKIKSKLAGGIELFSVSNISFIQGRGDISTLTSTRLINHYSELTKDLDRTNLGYEIIKVFNKVTEDTISEEYFNLLNEAFYSLNNSDLSTLLIYTWFVTQIIRLGGHSPELIRDSKGKKLIAEQKYNFEFASMTFESSEEGQFNVNHIKLLRLTFNGYKPRALQQIKGIDKLLIDLQPVINTLFTINLDLNWAKPYSKV